MAGAFMRAGEHLTNCDPVTKSARDQEPTHLVFLLKGMNRAPTVSGRFIGDIRPKAAAEALLIIIKATTGRKIHESDEATS
jgi:hypothetical protein